MVACCGLVLLYKALRDSDERAARQYLDSAFRILAGTVSKFMMPSPTKFAVDLSGTSDLATFPDNEPATQPGVLTLSRKHATTNGVNGACVKCPETILDAATVCNYEFASRRWADHGLVYADYYFLLLGNLLLELGLV
jgi:hypothetical protein